VRSVLITVCLVVVAAACGDSITDDTFAYPVDPREAETCEELAAVAFDLVQLALDGAAGLSVAELEDPETGAAFRAQFAENGALVEFRRERMGCTQEEMDAYFCQNVGELLAEGAGAEFFLLSMQSQVGCG